MSEPQPTVSKPLDQKSDAELQREARARLRRLNPVTAASLVEETLTSTVNRSTSGFVMFLREKAIVGLAVGFAIGTQVQAVVKTFLGELVDPLFKLLLPGNQALSDRKWHVSLNGQTADFGWGALASNLLDFLFILFIIYLVIRVFKLEQLDKK